MPLYLGQDDAGTSSYSLQDFEPSWGSKMNAAVRESWLESYGPAGVDYLQSRMNQTDEAKLSAADAAAEIKKSGVKFGKSVGDGQYTKTQLSVLLDRQRELTAIKDVRERTPWDISSPVRGLGMFGAGIVDPINLATAFVPWTKSLSILNGARAGLMAESALTRAGSRALLGGADAAISTAVLEPAYSLVRNEIGDDYGAMDSIANIAFGTAFGGGLHAGGGAGLEGFRSLTGRAQEYERYRGLGNEEIQLVQALAKEIKDGMDPRDAARVAETFTPRMREAAGFPDADPVNAMGLNAGANSRALTNMISGGETRIRIGETYEPARWSVIDADQLTATVDKADNQFRDRSRAAYQTEIQQRANNLDFNLLADSPVMDYGAPTLAADGRIIGGNGRALFISRAYEIGKGADYRAALEARMVEMGIDPDAVRGMKKPVLVRVLQREVDVKRAAMLSNEGGSTDMSPLEQAKVDAERLGDVQLVVGADGDLNAPENRAAVRKWLEAQPENKRNSLVDEDGRLSATGIQRLNSALLFKAYGDSPTLGRLIESMDPGSRNVAMALGRTAPVLANARGAIASGDLHPLDIAADIQQAVEKYNSLRDSGMKVSDYMAQLDAFGDGLTPEATLLLDFMGRNIASPRRMADAITGFYDRLTEAGNPKQGDIFGGAAVPDKMALLDASIRQAEQGMDTAAEVIAGVAPETREATLRASVAQSVDGRMVDVDAIVGMDEAVGTATRADAVAAADRNFEPEQVALADFDASADVQARVDAAPKWDGVKDAEAALADADAALSDTVKAGDQAFKYSRGEAPGQKKATLWQGTTARFGAEEGAPLGRFRWDMINSAGGEQAQAFGYGHYLAQQAWISQTRYRERLLERRQNEDGYAIPDGAGGVVQLSAKRDDAAWQLADGTIVHTQQKDPKLAATADAVAQVAKYGLSRSLETFQNILKGAREELSAQQAKLAELESSSNAADEIPQIQIAMQKRGIEFQKKDIAHNELVIATLDEVTVDPGKLWEVFDPKDGVAVARFATEAEAKVDAATRGRLFDYGERENELAPGIQKYDPPKPENLRTRVMAGDQEVALSDVALGWLKSEVSRNQLDYLPELVQTLGRDLVETPNTQAGSNARIDVNALVAKLIKEGAGPSVLDPFYALKEQGVTSVTLEMPGSLYRAEMAGADFQNLALWNEPMSAQPLVVQAAFKKFGIEAYKPEWIEADDGLTLTRGSDVMVVNKVNPPEMVQLLSEIGWSIDKAPAGSPADWRVRFKDGSELFYPTQADAESTARREWLLNNGFGDRPFQVFKNGRNRNSFYTMDEAKRFSETLIGAQEKTVESAYEDLQIMIEEGDAKLEDFMMEAVSEAANRRGLDPLEVGTDDFKRAELASIMLNQAGVPGHAFLDGASRGAAQLPAYNLVIYADDVARIVDRYARQTGEIGRATDDPEGLTEALRLSFGKSTEALLEAGAVRIVATPADIPGGPHPADVKGATAPDGTVYIVSSNVAEAEARGMLLHEVGVHVGMERMLGTQVFQSVLSELDDAILRGEKWAQDARDRVPADTAPGLVREEQLAYLVQNAPELPIVQRIIAAVRAWAYRTFEFARENMTLTEADFRAMAVSALHHAARGGEVGGLVPAFARDVSVQQIDAAGGYVMNVPDVAIKGDGGNSPWLMADGKIVGTGQDHISFADSVLDGGVVAYDEFMNATGAIRAAFFNDVDAGYVASLHMADSQQPSAQQIAALRRIEQIRGEPITLMVGYRNGMVNPDYQVTTVDALAAPNQVPAKYSRGETPEPAKPADELKPYDEAVKRAKGYAAVLRAAADKLDNDAQATAAMRAAMPDISPVEITDLLDQLRRQVKGLRGVARSARSAMASEDVAAGLQTEAMKAADELANNLELAAVIEKRNAALNMNVRLKATAYVNQFRDAGLDFEGFRGLLVGTERKRAGGRISVEAEQKNFRGEWLGGMIADLEKQDLMRQFTSGEFDREISVALWNMGRKGDNSGLPPEAVKIAEIVNKYQTDARNTRNRFGAWIRDLQGYITRQSHNIMKIRDAGEKAFKEFVLPRLDMERSLRDFDGTADDFLTRVYDDFATGSHMKVVAGEDDMLALGRGSSLARRESVSRVLYFKDGNASFEYNQRFGQGRLAESVLQGLDQAGKSAGLLKLLGTNPEATVTRLFDEYAESLRGDPVRRAKFLQNRKELSNLLAQVDGSVNIPGNVTAAQISSFLRAWQSMAKLGGALISSVTDLAGYAAELRFGQDKNLLSGVLDGMGALTQGRAKGEKQQILSSLGVFHESTLGSVYARFDSPDLVGGKTAAAMQMFFKLNGLNWWTESLRDGYALTHAHYLATNTSKAFDKLPDALRDMLGLYNIDAGKWDVLRIATMSEADGRQYMTPDALRTVPRAALENYITSIGRTVSDASVQNLQDDLSSALRTMTIDRMHHAVLEPGARTRAFMLRGTQPGTVPGELLRFIGQFKSFPVALIQSTLGREVYGRGYDTLGDYLKNGKGDMVGLASFIALSTAMGYAAMATKDLLRGKNPRPLDDPRTWAAAMVQGGGLGLYGDFLFQKYNRMGGTLSGSMLGPVANVVDTAADLWTRIRTGDDVAATAFNAVLQNTPFMNLFYARTALDYLVLYKIQEALNPGFLRRMERRAERENGQTFYMPPSQAL